MARRRGLRDGGITDPDVTPPTAPATLLAADTAGDQGASIDLSWAAASDAVGVTGYKLYRGTAPGVYGTPTTLLATTSYTDTTAVTGTRYYYAVSAVDAAGNEGAKSPEATAIATDDLAPATPTGLAAVGGTKRVDLTWSANTEPDLAGYDVYRNGVKINGRADHGHHLRRHRPHRRHHLHLPRARGRHPRQRGRRERRRLCHHAGRPARRHARRHLRVRRRRGEPGPGSGRVSGTPQRAEYDSTRSRTARCRAGSPGPLALTYAGIGEKASDGMTADGSEVRFWAYFDTTNQYRTYDDFAGATADRASFIQFSNNGQIYAYTNRPAIPGYTANGYTSVGTYSTGWTQFRLVYNFTSQTYTLSKRASVSDAWTPLKSTGAPGYQIPFRGTEHHHDHPRQPLPRLRQHQPVARRRGLFLRRHRRCRHHAAHRACEPCRSRQARRQRRVHQPFVVRGL